MLVKYANCEILDVRQSSERVAALDTEGFEKLAKPTLSDDGYLYVRVRAISSRVNKNHDGWPSEELAKSYKTFEGRPIFVDHNNDNPDRTRGVIVASMLHVDDLDKASAFDPYYSTAPENHQPPTWIELLLEVDAKAFPKLAKAVINGDIDAVSMGSNISLSSCSVCGTKAKNPVEYCEHIKSGKGQEFEIVSSTGEKQKKTAYEDCYGVNFFEISFVFDPADETALIQEIRSEANAKTASGLYDPNEDDEEPAGSAESPGDSLATEPANREDEGERVDAWRAEQLQKAQFTPEQIRAILDLLNHQDMAAKPRGVRDFTDLVDQGASPDQAYAIQAKAEDEAEAEKVYDCKHCGDGDALRAGEDCAYCGNGTQKPAKKKAPLAERGGTTLATLAALEDFELEKTADGAGGYELNDHSERTINYEPQSEQVTSPPDVDTLRPEVECPRCGTELQADKTVGSMTCPECGHQQPPVGLDSPDLSLHHRLDQPVNQNNEEPAPTDDKMVDDLPVESEGMQTPISPVSPVSPISSTQSDQVISEMTFTTKKRFVLEDEKQSSIDKKVLQPDPNKKGTDEPQGTKIVSDQLAPVETQNKDTDMKTSDRETIKRVEEDGQGVKRTEEIIREHGPLGDAEPSADETSAVTDDGGVSPETDDPLAKDTPDENAEPTADPPAADMPKEHDDKPKWSSEAHLLSALKLAKFASEIGLISADDELEFVGEIEGETPGELTARWDTLQRVKDAGLAKKPRVLTAKRGLPPMPRVAAAITHDTDVPFEALFMS